MQYLLQSVEPKSKAERLVLSFPATAENYPKAIDQLKERFGREDLLVQIYVRELLNLVMKNAVSGRTKTDLSALYDELEGKLRSLESLGRTQEKYGDFLTPLVESCLPEEILMAWERKRNTETDAKGSRTLEHLMTFLRLEVQGEEMVQLAKSGFGTPIRKRDSPTERVKPTELMTASALASSEKSSENAHKSTDDFPVICYTDGSKIDGRVGFAFVVFRSGVESENFQFRIRDECTVFVAELLCLNFAVKWIIEQNSVISEYLICTDSLSSLDSLKCISSSNNIIVEIQKQLKSLRDKNISIDFAFVRGHTGVLGNERADWLAKAATKRKIDIDVNIPKSFYKKITNERMMKSWNQEYLISNKGSITKKFFPTINKRLSCHHFYTNYKLTQFLTGHGNFKSYLNKFNLAPSSFCDCNIGGEENVEHVILLCSKQWEDLNIIERVPEVELNNECHYLPHRPVIKLDSATTKIRPVFDASAREKGKPSLNDCLYKGVNLIELIPDILDRFRIYPVGIVADIEKAFLMLSVAPKDRDYLRFFFPCNEKQLVYRHCRVVFGVSSSPYLLNASIMHLLENCNSECKEIAQKLKSSIYVDNCATGVFSADEIEIFIEKTKLIMSEGCFNLRIFESNVASKSVDKHSGETFILSIIWDLDNDVLKCCTNFDSLTCEVKITKRLVLSTVQKFSIPLECWRRLHCSQNYYCRKYGK
ncbi:integrase catalytic domain-containing protein [Trichonephila clavipes]|nr:integrase catalytic domain-containing protein [Trichonephila clavipes]